MKPIRRFVVLFCLASLACSLFTLPAPIIPSFPFGPTATPIPSSTPSASPTPVPPPPNIVFILTDDMTVADLDYMPQTRALLADQGTTFDQFFVSMALCCPSRSCILRGQYPHNTQIVGNVEPDGGFEKFHRLGRENSTVAVWLQQAGYRTALFGKYLNGYPGNQGPLYIPPGWTEWYSPAKGNPYKEYDYTLNENGTLVEYKSAPSDYGTDVYASKAADFIQRSAEAGAPFFAFISTYAPHAPATAAPRHSGLFSHTLMPISPSFNEMDVSDKPAAIRDAAALDDAQVRSMERQYRERLRSLQAVDEMTANLVAQLETLGVLDNTYIFFSSDNGFHMGEHRLPPGKETAYEEDIRVPLLVRGPDVQAGAVVDALAGNIDFAPTFAEIARIAAPAFVDGRSLLPLLRGDPITDWRAAFLLERGAQSSATYTNFPLVPTPTAPVLEAPDSTHDRGPHPTFIGLRTADYTYVEYSTGEIELYDLHADPYELENLASTAEPSLLQTLHDWLISLKDCSADSCRAAEGQPN